MSACDPSRHVRGNVSTANAAADRAGQGARQGDRDAYARAHGEGTAYFAAHRFRRGASNGTRVQPLCVVELKNRWRNQMAFVGGIPVSLLARGAERMGKDRGGSARPLRPAAATCWALAAPLPTALRRRMSGPWCRRRTSTAATSRWGRGAELRTSLPLPSRWRVSQRISESASGRISDSLTRQLTHSRRSRSGEV